MKIDTMRDFNVPNGMTNNDFLHALGILCSDTGDTLRWTPEESDDVRTSFTTTDRPGFRAEVAIQGQDVEAKITNISDSIADERIVGKVDAAYPPELRVRSILAGTAYMLFKLAEAHTI